MVRNTYKCYNPRYARGRHTYSVHAVIIRVDPVTYADLTSAVDAKLLMQSFTEQSSRCRPAENGGRECKLPRALRNFRGPTVAQK